MAGHRPFSNLRGKMSPTAQERADAKAELVADVEPEELLNGRPVGEEEW